MRSDKQIANDEVLEHLRSEFPPQTEWSPTVWRKQYSILRNLLRDGHSHRDLIDAISYCRLKSKRLYSLGFVGYVIEESKQYWTQLREREAERLTMLESQNTPVRLDTTRKSTVPGWLRVDDDIEEVE